MINSTIPLCKRLKAYEEINRSILLGDPSQVLSIYLANYRYLTSRGPLEDRITRLLINNSKISFQQISWPAGITLRSSGFALVFTVCRIEKSAQWPGEAFFDQIKLISGKQKQLIAEAWAFAPNVPWLEDKEVRRNFVKWLIEEPETLSDCLLALGHLEDQKLITFLTPMWICRQITKPDLLDFIQRAKTIPALRSMVIDVLKICVNFYTDNTKHLLTILDCTFHFQHFEVVITCSEMLLDKNLSRKQRIDVLSKRLVALAERGHIMELSAEYKKRWIPLSEIFPHPEILLYYFQRNGFFDLERHLLESIEDTSTLYVNYSRQFLIGNVDLELLNGWAQLYHEDFEDETVLFGMTRCLIRLKSQANEELISNLTVRWEALMGYESHRSLAGSMLVLMNTIHHDIVNTFERYIQNVSLDDAMIQQASLKYIRALCRLKNWSSLMRFLDKPDIGNIYAICSLQEIAYYRLMALLAQLPESEDKISNWYRYWEELVGLFVSGENVAAMLGHMLALEQTLRKKQIGDQIITDDRYVDIRLQISRRVKAEAERLIHHEMQLSDEVKESFSRKFLMSSPEKTHRIMLELMALMPYEGEFYL